MSASNDGSRTPEKTTEDLRLVVRSNVEAGRKYPEYRQELRYDFFYSCAYCTMNEFEAQSIRMTIDHYEPRKARPDLENDYENLMYACSPCNERKGDRCPPPQARQDGKRFFRPDLDVRDDHFEKEGILLNPLSPVGEFTIQMVDLNRHALLKLRELRERIAKCDPLVVSGVMALRSFHIDQLPPKVRGGASVTMAKAEVTAHEMRAQIDSILRSYARSEMIDPDTGSAERAIARAAFMKDGYVSRHGL